MAVVTSLTKERILELLSGIATIAESQEEANALVAALSLILQQNQLSMTEWTEVTLPAILEQLAANDIAVGDLVDNALPNLQQAMETNQGALEDLNTVTIPSLQESLAAAEQNLVDAPKVYVQPDPPTNPDDDDRYLVTGDSWYDSNDNNKLRVWNGVEWTTFGIDIPDLSLTVIKFNTSTHMIY